MIILHKLNGEEFILNCELIETVHESPDTIIRLTTDNRHIVRERAQEVIDATVAYKQRCFNNLLRIGPGRDDA